MALGRESYVTGKGMGMTPEKHHLFDSYLVSPLKLGDYLHIPCLKTGGGLSAYGGQEGIPYGGLPCTALIQGKGLGPASTCYARLG